MSSHARAGATSLSTLALIGLGTIGGCGWSHGLVAPEGVQSVGIEVFRAERGLYERDLEADLHAELSRAVSDLVGVPLVAPAEADLVLRGEILGYRRRSGIRTRDNQLRETGVRVEIQAELVTRAQLAERRAQEAAARRGEEPAAGQGNAGPRTPPNLLSTRSRVWSGYALDDPGNELAARDRALRYLAETIILDLFTQPAPEELAPPEDSKPDGQEPDNPSSDVS